MFAIPFRSWLATFGSILCLGSLASAQGPVPPEGVEVLARGEVHEAYASTGEFPTPGEIVRRQPPEPIEELPPDQRPEGDNVQWIPGYWNWDDERNDFIWISGFWRDAPPGRVWVPGSWREGRGGWQWASGFWQAAAQPAQNLEYLPAPPQPLEIAPQIPAPEASSFYVPGSWIWRGRFVWRPGFWIDHRPGWIWVPACYRWSPAGYVFIDGYWDHPLHERGVLFAPVAFQPALIARRRIIYTPTYVVAQPALVSSLFIRRGYCNYYFGDYFEQRHQSVGFSAWCGTVRGSSFSLSIGFGRATTYDPNWAYYQLQHRANPAFVTGVGELYAGRYRGELPRPPRTLVQQNTVINNITNVTNITNNVTNVRTVVPPQQALTVVAPLNSVKSYNPNVNLQPLRQADRTREVELARQLSDVGRQRSRLESGLAVQPQSSRPVASPRQVKLDLPQSVVARAQSPVVMNRLPQTPVPQQSREPLPRPTALVNPSQIAPGKPVGQPVPAFGGGARPGRPVETNLPVKPAATVPSRPMPRQESRPLPQSQPLIKPPLPTPLPSRVEPKPTSAPLPPVRPPVASVPSKPSYPTKPLSSPPPSAPRSVPLPTKPSYPNRPAPTLPPSSPRQPASSLPTKPSYPTPTPAPATPPPAKPSIPTALPSKPIRPSAPPTGPSTPPSAKPSYPGKKQAAQPAA